MEMPAAWIDLSVIRIITILQTVYSTCVSSVRKIYEDKSLRCLV